MDPLRRQRVCLVIQLADGLDVCVKLLGILSPVMIEPIARRVGFQVGFCFRGGQLRGGVGLAGAPEPDRRVADPDGLGQMPGPGTVSAL